MSTIAAKALLLGAQIIVGALVLSGCGGGGDGSGDGNVKSAGAPILSSPTPSGTLGSTTTATLAATTNQSSGAFYAVIDSAANLAGVNAAQIEAGRNKNGASALAAANAAVSTATPNVAVSGLTAATEYSYAAVQTDSNGTSNIVSGTFTTASLPPSLSSPTPSGIQQATTTVTLGATTNQSSGTLYGVIDTAANLSGVTAAQIEAGRNKNGAAALAAAKAAVSTAAPSATISGLTAATAYSYAEVQTDSHGTSNIVSGTFTTASLPPTLSSPAPSGTLRATTTVTLAATTTQTSGTFYGVVDSSAHIAGITAAQIEAGENNTGSAATASGNAPVSSSSPSVAVTGLAPSTSYSYAEVQTNDNGTSNIATGVFTAYKALGTNLQANTYYSNEMPFLNIVKEAGSNTPFTGWSTGAPSKNDTGEEGALNLDADGYPLQIPQPGLISTFVYTLVFRSATNALAPGQVYFYPPGDYTVQCAGAGTIVIAGDASGTVTCPTGGTFSVATPTGNGLYFEITASTAGNHIHNLSIVQTNLVSSYNSGAIFHPTFLAAMANFTSFRFMDWKNTNGQTPVVGFAGSPTTGNTSATLNAAWSYPSGTYNIYFIPLSDHTPASEAKAATFTFGSTNVTWSGGLANNYLSYAPVDVSQSWANRSLPSNAFYTLTDGPPVEVEVALCNAIGANCWFNLPVTASDAYIKGFGQLVINGSGAQSGYLALNSAHTAYVELSNEVWNSSFGQYSVAGDLGYIMWPAAAASTDVYAYNRNWYGMRTAQMADDLQTAIGSGFSRVVPVLGAQLASTGSATSALTTTLWSSGPASNYPIKALAIAPYWGGNFSPADCTTITGVTSPLDDFFALATSNVGTVANGGHVYSSVASNGYEGQTQGQIPDYVSLITAYPALSLVAYEGGQGFIPTVSGTCGGWPALVTSAERDARMGTAYTTMLNWWSDNVGSGSSNIENLYDDVFPISQYGAWGALEDIMQPISPLSSAPAKWQGIQNYIQ